MNHCIHGFTINEYCPLCEYDMIEFAEWLGISHKYLDSFEMKHLMEAMR